MTRFELIGRITEKLHTLNQDDLLDLLAQLEDDITDENMTVITDGADDTEHLLSNPKNAADLMRAVEELEGQDLLMPESEHAA